MKFAAVITRPAQPAARAESCQAVHGICQRAQPTPTCSATGHSFLR